MAVQDIVLRGFGSTGSISLITTIGFESGISVEVNARQQEGKGSGAIRKKKKRRDSLYPDDVIHSGTTPQEIISNNESQETLAKQEVVLIDRKELSSVDLASVNLVKLPGESVNLYKHSIFIKGKEYDLEKIVLLLLD